MTVNNAGEWRKKTCHATHGWLASVQLSGGQWLQLYAIGLGIGLERLQCGQLCRLDGYQQLANPPMHHGVFGAPVVE